MNIKRIREGGMTPWYYVRVYYDVCRMQSVVAVFPLCYAILVFYRIRDAWYRFRGRPTWIDARIQEALLSVDPSRVTGDIYTVFDDYDSLLDSMKINGSHDDAIKMLETCINAYALPKDIYPKDPYPKNSALLATLEEIRVMKIMNDKLDEVLDES